MKNTEKSIRSQISFHRIFTRLMIIAAVFLISAPQKAVHAEGVRVVAVVNGQPITNLDMQERLVFLTGTTGITVTDENRDRINQDVLQMLIDDVIKREEGFRLGRGFENSARNHAVELVNASFSQHGEDPDVVMDRLGINRKVAENKFLTDVVWASAIQSRYADQFANIRTEAEQELGRIRENAFKPQVELDEIILVPEPNRNFTQTMDVANQMYEAILQGADFGRIAQQYSATGSARNGGQLGWIPLDRLSDDVRALVESVPSGAIARPVEIDGAVALYRIKGIRRDGNADPLESVVTVARLVQPVEATDETSRSTAAVALNAEIKGINTCEGLDPVHQRGGSGSPLIMGEFKLGEFAPKLRSVLLELDEGEKTEPINFAEGLVVFMICEKIIPELQLPSIEELEAKIRNSHFSVIASRHLQRLRRNAVISIRDDA